MTHGRYTKNKHTILVFWINYYHLLFSKYSLLKLKKFLSRKSVNILIAVKRHNMCLIFNLVILSSLNKHICDISQYHMFWCYVCSIIMFYKTYCTMLMHTENIMPKKYVLFFENELSKIMKCHDINFSRLPMLNLKNHNTV